MNDNINIEEFFTGLTAFSHGKLLESEGLKIIISSAFRNGLMEELNDLVFNAKYVTGLFRVLSSAVNNPEIKNIDDIKKDLAINVEKCTVQIQSLIKGAEEKGELEKKYFELTKESFSNFKNLLSDLAWAKMYTNDLKRTKLK